MKLILDRINTDANGKRIACFELGDMIVKVSEDNMPIGFMDKLFSNVIIDCNYENGKIENPILLIEETKRKEEVMRNRLNSLFNKKEQ